MVLTTGTQTDREGEKERQKEIKEGRRQINCQTD